MTGRELALRVLYRFDTEQVFVRETLDHLLRRSSFDARDRGFITELVYGTLRWRGRLDWILGQVVTRRLDSLTPWIRNILRLGAYQILMLDRASVPAATDEAVKLARRYGHKGTAGLTNAVLRNVSRRRDAFRFPDIAEDPVGHAATVYSYPSWIVTRWIDRYGLEGALALCDAGNATPPVTIRVNGLRITPAALQEKIQNAGVHAEMGRYLDDFLTLRDTGDITALEGYEAGWFQVQDESAGLAVRLLDPQPGETVVDLCCAPGGKTTYIAGLMGDRGVVIGIDISGHRLRRVQAHCRRLGVTQTRLIAADGRHVSFRKQVDRVLIDAPCSGLGTIARRAELRWRRKMEDILEAQKIQAALMDQGAQLVRPGGVMVYSTCTIEPEENDDIISSFCDRHQAFRIDPAPENATGVVGVTEAPGYIRTLPSIHGVDGSFAVRLRRAT